jgi:signal transduction histidine kinase
MAVVALLSLAALGSVATLLFAWHARQDMARLVMRNEAGTFTTLELSVALLRQRGIAGAYIMDGGNRRWLDELQQQEPAFSAGLDRADKAADTPQEHEIIARMRQAFGQYDQKRDEVIALFDQGETEEARLLYLGDASAFYDEVARLCDELLDADREHTQTTLVDERSELKRVSYFVGGNVVLAAALAGGLVWFLVVGVFRPIHRMAASAGLPSGSPMADDLSTLGYYIRSLAAEYSEAQSDLQKSRGELRSSAPLAALGRAVAHVAHEIRNPLAAIGGFARAIEKRAEDPQRVREHARIISDEVSRLERILTDIMTVSTAPTLAPRLQPLNDVVARTADLIRVQMPGAVALEVDCDPAAPAVPFDSERIEQVLINLVRNAVEVLPGGGIVRISTRACNGGTELIVRDDGPGMPEEVMARAFEAFYTTKRKGTGLGLAVSRQIVLAHGGDVRLESAPGKGTTFTIYLPGSQNRGG